MGNKSKNIVFWRNFEVPEGLRKQFRAAVMKEVNMRASQKGGLTRFVSEVSEIKSIACEILTDEFITKYPPKGHSANDMGIYTNSDRERLEEGLSRMIPIWIEETIKRKRRTSSKDIPTGQSSLDKSFPLVDKRATTTTSSSMRSKKIKDIGSSPAVIDLEDSDEVDDQRLQETSYTTTTKDSNKSRSREAHSPTDVPYSEDEGLPELSEILTPPIRINKERPIDQNADPDLPEVVVQQGHDLRAAGSGTVQNNESIEKIVSASSGIRKSATTQQYTSKLKRTHSQYSIVSTEFGDSSANSESDTDRPISRRRLGKMRAIEHPSERAESIVTVCNVSYPIEDSAEGTAAESEREAVRFASSLAGATIGTPAISISREQDTVFSEHSSSGEFGGNLLEYFRTCRDTVLEAANQISTTDSQGRQLHHDAALLDHVCRDIESRMLAWLEVRRQSSGTHQITSFTLYR